jgi:hypothetical protein
MAHVNNARQWQRFAYPSDIRLAVGSAPLAEPQITSAVCLDLSLGGVQLLAPNSLDIGAPVSCLFPGGHHELRLPGFVRWSAADPRYEAPRSRVGIEFAPLSAAGRQALQALLSQVQHAGEVMRVHLPSCNEPLLGVAVPGEHGVHLRVPLPFFACGSVVKFEPLAGGGAFEGRVLGTQMRACPETQALELDLLLEPCQPARQRRYMVYEGSTPAPPEKRPSRLTTVELSPLRVPKMRTNRWLAVGAVAAAALWVFALRRDFPWQQHRVAEQARSASEASRKKTRTRAKAPKPAELAEHTLEQRTEQSARGVPPASDGDLPRVLTLGDVPPRVGAPVSAAETKPSASGFVGAGLEPASSAPLSNASSTSWPRNVPPRVDLPSSDESTPWAARSAGASAPRCMSTGDSTELFVPVSGSIAGLQMAVWADPLALALDLPAGRIALPRSRYEIRSGVVQRMSFGQPHKVTQLRVYLTAPVTRYSASETQGGVVIHLKHEPVSHP